MMIGRCLVPGRATGNVLYSDVPLSFWMGIDVNTGEIIDQHHPLCGEVVTGRIVVLPSGRGSCSGSCALLELIMNGRAPAALIFGQDEIILTLGAIVAGEIFDKSIPIAAVSADDFEALRGVQFLSVADGVISTTASAAGADSGAGQTICGPSTLDLTVEDRAVLAGEHGKARQAALRIVVRSAELQGVSELIDVQQAHIDCCFYTGPAGLAFAEKLCAWGGSVKVPSTTNASSVDGRRWRAQGIGPDLGEASDRVASAYVRMGAQPSFTCAPYLLDSAPIFGQQIAWGESNAVVYANSVVGARTMKYPDYLDVCVALTGRAPLISCHLDKGRRATMVVDVPDIGPLDDAFYPLLGYHVGLLAPHAIPVITGLEAARPSLDDLKAFSAAFATTSASPMFHMLGITPEATTLEQALGGRQPMQRISITAPDLLNSWRELNTATTRAVDLVSLGNPHFSLTEFGRTAGLCRGRTKKAGVRLVITSGRATCDQARDAGLIAALEEFGAEIWNDTCWCMIGREQLPDRTRTLMTNSAKFAHYGPGVTGRGIHFAGLEACISAACTGAADLARPPWLAEPARSEAG